ncbi:MAG: glycosyltransferase family 1 protein [Tuberibacillus sp.]
MSKRVLHVVSAMNRGGTETLLMNVYRQIDRSKIQFDFVSHRNEVCHYDEEIESLGGNVIRIPSLGESGPVTYIKNIKSVLAQHSYIAVHSHTDFQSGFAAYAAKRHGVQNIVCHAHTNRWEKKGWLANKMILPFLRSLIRYSATDYCACSEEAGAFLFGEKAKDKVKILKNGIDIEQFLETDKDEDLRKELNLSQDLKILGHIGNLSPVKNQAFILKLLRRLRDDGLNAVAVFAGDGPDLRNLEEQCRFLKIQPYVYFLGVRTDIPRLLRAFDVFVFPSLYEGFGIAAIEAQCAGKPCIVSRNVPVSTDLGLGLMTYLDLNDDMDIWISEMKRALEKEQPNRLTIEKRFAEKGYVIRDNVPDWLRLYGISG